MQGPISSQFCITQCLSAVTVVVQTTPSLFALIKTSLCHMYRSLSCLTLISTKKDFCKHFCLSIGKLSLVRH